MESLATAAKLRMDRDFYERVLKSNITAAFDAQHCLIFALPLPFQLPLKDSTCFWRVFPNLSTAFLFEKYETESHDGTFPEKSISYGEMRTRVEMAVILPDTPTIRSITDIAKLTDDSYTFLYSHAVHLIQRLNNYVYAYRLLCEDCKTYSISVEQFFLVYTQIHALPGWDVQLSGPLVVSANSSNYQNIITNLPEQYTRAIEFLGRHLDRSGGEFVAASQFFADARRYLYRGYFREAAVFMGMSSEAFLNGIFRHVRKADGKSDAEIETEFEEVPFMTRLKKHISHALGGDWDLTKGTSQVAEWKKQVYDLRNRVVHGGYFPAPQETAAAFMTIVSFSEFLRQRIEANKVKLANAHVELAQLPKFFVHGQELSTFDIS